MSVPEAESLFNLNTVEKLPVVEPIIVENESLNDVKENVYLSSLTVKTLPVINLSDGGTYLDFNATSGKYISADMFGGLRKISENIYSDNKDTYLLEEIINDCTHAIEYKLIEIEFSDISTLEVQHIDEYLVDKIIKSRNEVLINYLKVGADSKSFKYLGKLSYSGSPTENSTYFLFQDKERVFLIKSDYEMCKGQRITDITSSSDFANADVASFEYLGMKPKHDETLSFAKDKNYFYWYKGILSKDVTPITCPGDFFNDCFAKIESLQGYYIPEEILSNIVKKVITQEFKDEQSLECLVIKNEDQGDFRVFNVTKVFNSTCPGDVTSAPRLPTFKINRLNGDVLVMALDGSYSASLVDYYDY
jgi:hypothetical protein